MLMLIFPPLCTHPTVSYLPANRSVAAGGQFGLGDAYIPVKLLGRGGTGQTWLCREAATNNVYAVKVCGAGRGGTAFFLSLGAGGGWLAGRGGVA